MAGAPPADVRPVFPEGRQAIYERNGYSAGVVSGGFLFVSGQVGSDDDGEIVAGFEAQASQAFANLRNVLRAGGCTVADVVDVTIFVVDMAANVAALTAAKNEVFPRPPFPALTVIGVAELWGPCLIEIKVTARLPQAAG